MSKPGIHIFCIGLLLICIRVSAQEDELADTVFIQPVAPYTVEEPSNTFSYFDSAGATLNLPDHRMNDSMVAAIRNDPAFWYAGTVAVKEKRKREFWESQWFSTLMWFLLIGSFVSIIIWFLASGNIAVFRRRPGAMQQNPEQPVETEDIFLTDFNKAIHNALEAGDYHLAIRLHYLQILKLLSLKGLIRYSQDKTNSQYITELVASGKNVEFSRLTRYFEYVWYGRFPLSRENYDIMEPGFTRFGKSLGY